MDLPPIDGGEEYIGEGIYNHVANKLSNINIEGLFILEIMEIETLCQNL
ncbi:MAG: hypothetical protein ACLUSV_01630 [Streptococcus sp.]